MDVICLAFYTDAMTVLANASSPMFWDIGAFTCSFDRNWKLALILCGLYLFGYGIFILVMFWKEIDMRGGFKCLGERKGVNLAGLKNYINLEDRILTKILMIDIKVPLVLLLYVIIKNFIFSRIE